MADTEKPAEQTPHAGGRPLKFATVTELKQKIEQYFGECDSHVSSRQFFKKKADGSSFLAEEEYLTERQPYTVNGLARALRTSRDVLIDYESGKYDDKDDTDESGDKFSNAIKDAKARINEDVERRTMSGETPPAAGIFWLKNNNGWKDRSEIDHTTKDQPIPLLAGLAPAKLEVDEDGPASADDSSHKDQ